MSWILLVGLVLALALALAAAWSRRVELARMHAHLERRDQVAATRPEGLLHEPVVDLSRCLGCGTCIRSCPEGGVLELVHGQAQVVQGARCVGHGACERECPVSAITVRVANLATRRDVPNISAELEADGQPGVFLAGEVTARGLIRSALEQGTSVARAVAARPRSTEPGVHDLVIVGAGPAGLACALEARRLGLSILLLEQESSLGGTVARYPRKKLVLTQPLELPNGARLERAEYAKEELVELWERAVREQQLPLRLGVRYEGLERDAAGRYAVAAGGERHAALQVCLAIGRRGVPRRLGVPGEDAAKVAYALLDARSYRDRRVAVVGGGDSAAEVALALAEQPGNAVTLVHRGADFPRLRARNAERLARARAEHRLEVATRTQVAAITPGELLLHGADGAPPRVLANHEVFVLAGGTAPVELLERAGVSCDPSARPAAPQPVERGAGVLPALAIGLGLALVALAFALWNSDYYALPMEARPASDKHDWLRPSRGIGLGLAVLACAAIAFNLLYLARRAQRFGLCFGSLQAWMTSHVATGVIALPLALLHAAMSPRDTAGGHALAALAVLLVTGAIGRYFYSWLPRAANGSELALAEIERELERTPGLAREQCARILRLARERQWHGGFLARVRALVGGEREIERAFTQDLPADEAARIRGLARRAYRHALAAAHYEDLRALLGSWRYLHRWIAVLMIALLVLHVAYALGYVGWLRGGAA